jgi:polysaccharide export outer membrane protein
MSGSFMKQSFVRLLASAALMAAALGAVAPTWAQAPAGSVVANPVGAVNEYRLGAGDVVRISVYQNPDLTLETRVTEAGVVSYPLLGSVALGGQTVTAAEGLIAQGLRSGNFVREPQVTVVVLQVRGNQASVLGQVNRPGRYALEMADMRLSDLLAMAGGTASNGADRIIVTGQRDGQPMREVVDLPALFVPGGAARDLLIRDGDTIWVDRQPLVYIYGEVQRPGPMRLERDMTLMQALATGGGLTQRGTEKGIRVHRRGADGKVEVVQLTMDETMREGDVVYVRESLF